MFQHKLLGFGEKLTIHEFTSGKFVFDLIIFFHYDKMDLVEARLDELLDSEFNHGEFYFRALSTMFYLISLYRPLQYD